VTFQAAPSAPVSAPSQQLSAWLQFVNSWLAQLAQLQSLWQSLLASWSAR
jgi:hypothetical protein